MSQVLEKPILLDETGQDISSKINGVGGKIDSSGAAIVSKLNDIKDAIGTSAEFIPISIRVIAPPTKVTYKVGERLDLSGMVVNLIGSNGVQIDVTSACTCNPANGAVLTANDTAVAISYTYQHEATTFTTSQALNIRALDSIAVTTPPIKTAYQTGETLDLTGIVVTATYTDGFTANVTPDCTFVPQNGTVLTTGDTSVTVSYTEGGTTKTTTIAIGVKELLSIAVTHLPIKTAYHAGETLDLFGLVVTASYDDSSSLDVTAHCTFSPDEGDTLTTSNTSVAISYTEGTVTKTTSQVITVIGLSSIAITTPPTKVDYTKNETLDLTGIVVTATYSDNSTAVVTSLCTFNPADGATLTTSNTGVTASYTEGGVTKTATQAITVIVPIYGAEWDGTSTTSWTRTDLAANFTDPVPQMAVSGGGWTEGSSPFDNIQPWAGMVRVSDSDAGELVAIPKFYYKITQNNAALKIQISSQAEDGFSVSPAHMDRGDGEGERDVVYVGRYHCATSTYKSTRGVNPHVNKTRSSFRSAIHDLGSDIWQMDFATWFTIWLLYLVEFADWNSQAVIGKGTGTGAVSWMGYTDNMTYHTGTNNTSKDTNTLGTQYRYIEGLWDNVVDWCDGCYYDANGLNIILNPSNFSDSSGGTTAGLPRNGGTPPSGFTLEEVSGIYPLFIPTATIGRSYTTYSCDKWDFDSDNPCLAVGGLSYNSDQYGLFYVTCWASSYKYEKCGARLMKLPSNS